MKPCYIVDIDGTVANIEHRLHFIEKSPKDWENFFKACVNDKPINTMFRMLEHLESGATLYIRAYFMFVTGRPERSRDDTLKWLESDHIMENGDICSLPLFDNLYMRADGDRREDWIVKQEILAQIRADGYEPIMAFDDRTQVVKMWRDNGIQCLQVADGNY